MISPNIPKLLNNIVMSNYQLIDYDLINQLIEKASIRNDYSFKNGLSGIGWLLSHLYDKNIYKINIDEYLHDFDDNIYKLTLSNISLYKTKEADLVLDYCSYLHQRLLNTKTKHDVFRKFALYECLVIAVTFLLENLDKLKTSTAIKVLIRYTFLENTILSYKGHLGIHYFKYFEKVIKQYENKKLNKVDIENVVLLYLSACQYKQKQWIMILKKILNNNHNSIFLHTQKIEKEGVIPVDFLKIFYKKSNILTFVASNYIIDFK